MRKDELIWFEFAEPAAQPLIKRNEISFIEGWWGNEPGMKRKSTKLIEVKWRSEWAPRSHNQQSIQSKLKKFSFVWLICWVVGCPRSATTNSSIINTNQQQQSNSIKKVWLIAVVCWIGLVDWLWVCVAAPLLPFQLNQQSNQFSWRWKRIDGCWWLPFQCLSYYSYFLFMKYEIKKVLEQ